MRLTIVIAATLIVKDISSPIAVNLPIVVAFEPIRVQGLSLPPPSHRTKAVRLELTNVYV